MTTLLTSPDFPLYSIAIIDWLPKIGEKAFLAWMNFHTWKDSSQAASNSTILPLPLNQVIKRLKVGNSTFYNQILRPLWNYGLIELEKIPGTNQFRIQVHFFPQTQPEKANQPLTQIRDYDQDWSSCPASKPESTSDGESVVVQAFKEEGPTDPLPQQQDGSQLSPHQVQAHPQDSVEKVEKFLPPLISEAIHADPFLFACKTDVENVYLRCRKHPHYSDMGFLQKTRECLSYQPHVEKFAAYLYKAIINEWNRPVSIKPRSSPPSSQYPVSIPPCPHDVPEWVWRQHHQLPAKPPSPLSPEQQAITDHLLHEISLIGR